MHRRFLTILALFASVAGGTSGCGGSQPTSPGNGEAARTPARGIVLVTVDGWWDAAAPGDPFTTESLPGAVRFADAMTPCPQARPAVVSILTGQTPDRTGIRDDLTRPLTPEIPYLPEIVSKAGWQTAAFVASPHVGIGSGLERGFGVFDAPREFMFGPFRHQPKLRTGDEVVGNFSTWSKGIEAGRPFFAWVHLAFGGPAAGGQDAEPPGQRAAAVAAAWKNLTSALAEEGPLRAAAVVVAATSGKVDRSTGETSGYFLIPSILRVPALYRPGSGAKGPPDTARPIAASDLAALLAEDAGIEPTFPDAVSPRAAADPSRVRFAWTWRGARDFNWPVQAAALRGDILVVSDGDGSAGSAVSWSTGAAAPAESVVGLVEALAARPQWNEPRTAPAVALPAELKDILAKAQVAIPSPEKLPPPPTLRARTEQLAVLLAARSQAQRADAVTAMETFDRVAAQDPANTGARVEAGQLLTLVGRHKKARERLEAALRVHPFHAEAWHWLGHTALGLQERPKADAVLRLADFLGPHNADVLYDLACARSLLEDVPGAEAFLRRAWSAGYRDAEHIEADPDLRNLRADPRYARFMQEVVR